MTLNIRNKLILAFLALNAVLLAIILYSHTISLRDGAFRLAQTMHLRLMTDQARMLTLNYEYHGGWDKVVTDDLLIVQLMFPGAAAQSPQERFEGAPRQSAAEFFNNRPKGKAGTPLKNRRPPASHKLANGKPVHLWIYDVDHQLIRGVTEPDNNYRIIEIKSKGKIIGYLGRPMSRELIKTTKEEVFYGAKNQLYIGLSIAIFVSILLALLLSTFFVKPITRLSKAVHKLASGDFAQRIEHSGKDEIARLALDVNFLADALEQSKESRERWIRDIGHELRTPLTVIGGELELIQAGIQQPDTQTINSLIEEFNQLNHLIDDLRILAQSDLGALGFEKHDFNLVELLQQYSIKAETQLQQKNLVFSFQCSDKHIPIFADAQRLRQLLDNLLQNSIRYTYSPGTVELALRAEGDKIRISWKDSSPSVDIKELGKLFERLYRVESSRSRATAGSGLGLSICKAIVTSHQGLIWAEQSNIGGVSIEIELPLNKTVVIS
ncbi:MAG: HAMP domain-containing protein [Saccharospirillaceae bacterium]|nr:ATP-binding protein [Pseudomonadales bacterium]NRB78456.1 HAMP domain-containing protein [Saccharospirillaceae bacterium]